MMYFTGEIHPAHDPNEFEGLGDCLKCDRPAFFSASDMLAPPLPHYPTLSDLTENPNMDAELAVIPNTHMDGIFDIFKAKKKKEKKPKVQPKQPAPIPYTAPASKVESFVDQYGKYVVIGVGTVALVAVIALLMTKKGE